MILKVYSPIGVVLDVEIQKMDFEALNGYYTLMPKHVDFVTAMPPNIVKYQTTDNKNHYMACNHGILVKQGSLVSMSVQKAILNDSLDTLTDAIQNEFKKDEEERKELNTAMARLEVGLTRGFIKLNKQDG